MNDESSHDGGRVVVGTDPHKRSVTIEVMTADETVLGLGSPRHETRHQHAPLPAMDKAPRTIGG